MQLHRTSRGAQRAKKIHQKMSYSNLHGRELFHEAANNNVSYHCYHVKPVVNGRLYSRLVSAVITSSAVCFASFLTVAQDKVSLLDHLK